ncbi:hypothetical protein H0O02_00105 [Candidatus Micrarchaeota archaeon]|nr:hypothetical protein [Candidatus Micrarchaeota archaeon]
MAKVLVGEVDHVFGKLNVAALKLKGELKVGDRISIENKEGTTVVQETITSMQVVHKPVEVAQAGDDITIKVAGKVHAGNLVYKITEG